MKDFELDDDGDLVLDSVTGDLVLIDDPGSAAQILQIGLSMQLGEWSQNLLEGFDWERYVMVDNPDPNELRAALQTFILNSPGIVAINSLDAKLDTSTREYTVSGEVQHASGEILPISTLGTVPGG